MDGEVFFDPVVDALQAAAPPRHEDLAPVEKGGQDRPTGDKLYHGPRAAARELHHRPAKFAALESFYGQARSDQSEHQTAIEEAERHRSHRQASEPRSAGPGS